MHTRLTTAIASPRSSTPSATRHFPGVAVPVPRNPVIPNPDLRARSCYPLSTRNHPECVILWMRCTTPKHPSPHARFHTGTTYARRTREVGPGVLNRNAPS